MLINSDRNIRRLLKNPFEAGNAYIFSEYDKPSTNQFYDIDLIVFQNLRMVIQFAWINCFSIVLPLIVIPCLIIEITSMRKDC